MKKSLKISLLVATYGRKNELQFLLESLVKQSYQNFEVIIIDQNPKGFLDDTLHLFNGLLSVQHVYSSLGLSLARNVGLRYADGDIIAFPDDDCLYASDTLEHVVAALKKSDILIASELSVMQYAQNEPIAFSDKNHVIKDRKEFFRCAPSFTLFFKKDAAIAAGAFNEKLGVGAQSRWGAGEESDYVVRAFQAGFSAARNHSIRVYHPTSMASVEKLWHKGFSYGRGRIKVLREHKFSYSFIAINILYPLVKTFLSLHKKEQAKFYFGIFCGRCAEIMSKNTM